MDAAFEEERMGGGIMLKGQKVTLRAIQKEDLATLYRFRNDVEITTLADDEPYVPQSSEAFEEFMTNLLKKESEGVGFAIEADGKLIGSVGIFHFEMTSRRCELGIAIGDRDYLGKGYGTEAVNLLVDYAFRLRNFNKVTLEVMATNERAYASYLKCGFAEEGRLRQHLWNDGGYRDVIAMGLLRSDWEKAAT